MLDASAFQVMRFQMGVILFVEPQSLVVWTAHELPMVAKDDWVSGPPTSTHPQVLGLEMHAT